jgi:hypothetical protein
MKLVEPFFIDSELQNLAMSAEALAHTKRKDAEAQAGSSVASLARREAEDLEQLAAKCNRMRTRAWRVRPGAEHVCDREGASAEVTIDAPTCSVCGMPQVFD